MANEEIREQNIERVLLAAYDSFLSVGIEKTTQALIAQKTGLSLRTVCRYFTSKDQMVMLVAKYVLDTVKYSSNSPPYNPRTVCKSGIEQLEQYFSHVQSMYFMDPRIFLLRAEFEIYFFRNKVFENRNYDKVVAEANNRPVLREILSIGIEDGTIKCSDDLDFEVRLICNAYLGFICSLSLNTFAQMETEEVSTQFDAFFKRLLNQYRS